MPRRFLLFFLILSQLLAFVTHATSSHELTDQSRLLNQCRPEGTQDGKLFSSDFGWKYVLADITKLFTDAYGWDKRLPRRAYYDPTSRKFKLPYFEERGGDIELSPHLVRSVISHIEGGLQKGYVDAIIFPDMGHSHFHIPKKKWDEKYNQMTSSIDKYTQFYEEVFRDPELRILYHTAEQIRTLDENKQPLLDRPVLWRYITRNFFTWNDESGRFDFLRDFSVPGGANTVGNVEGHFLWSAGYNLSANKNGCFKYTYQGKDYYFDLSMYDLEPDPSRRRGNEYDGF